MKASRDIFPGVSGNFPLLLNFQKTHNPTCSYSPVGGSYRADIDGKVHGCERLWWCVSFTVQFVRVHVQRRSTIWSPVVVRDSTLRATARRHIHTQRRHCRPTADKLLTIDWEFVAYSFKICKKNCWFLRIFEFHKICILSLQYTADWLLLIVSSAGSMGSTEYCQRIR